MPKFLPFCHQWTISGYRVLQEDKIHGHPFISSTVNCNKHNKFVVNLFPKGYNQEFGNYVSIKSENSFGDIFTFVDCTISIVNENKEKVNTKEFTNETFLSEFVTNEQLLNPTNGLLNNNGDLTLNFEGFLKSNESSDSLESNSTINKANLTTDIFNAKTFPVTESYALKWNIENVGHFMAQSKETFIVMPQFKSGDFVFNPRFENSNPTNPENFTFLTKIRSNQTNVAAPFSCRYSIVDSDGKCCKYFRREIVSKPGQEHSLNYQINKRKLKKQAKSFLPHDKLTLYFEVIKMIEIDKIEDLNNVNILNYLRLICSMEVAQTNVTEWTVDAKSNTTVCFHHRTNSERETDKKEVQLFINEKCSTLNSANDQLELFRQNLLRENLSEIINLEDQPQLLQNLSQILDTQVGATLSQFEQKTTEMVSSSALNELNPVIKRLNQEIRYLKSRFSELQNEKTVKQTEVSILVDSIGWLISKIGNFIKSFFTKNENSNKKPKKNVFVEQNSTTLNDAQNDLKSIKISKNQKHVHHHFENSTMSNVAMNIDSNVKAGNIKMQNQSSEKDLISNISQVVESKVEPTLNQMQKKLNEMSSLLNSQREEIQQLKQQLQLKDQEMQQIKELLTQIQNETKTFDKVEVVALVDKLELIIESLGGYLQSSFTQLDCEVDDSDSTSDDDCDSYHSAVSYSSKVDAPEVVFELTTEQNANCDSSKSAKESISKDLNSNSSETNIPVPNSLITTNSQEDATLLAVKLSVITSPGLSRRSKSKTSSSQSSTSVLSNSTDSTESIQQKLPESNGLKSINSNKPISRLQKTINMLRCWPNNS